MEHDEKHKNTGNFTGMEIEYAKVHFIITCCSACTWRYLFPRFSHISTSTLTITSVERFVFIFFPLKARDICTVTSATKVMVVLVVFFCLFEAQWFYIVGFSKETNECKSVTETAIKMSKVYKHFDAILYSYLPIGLMTIVNVAITGKLLFSKLGSNQNVSSSLSKAAKGITIMLLGTSLMFIILTLPYAVMYSVHADMSTYGYTFILLLLYCNHSFNIIIYSIGNTQFKKEVFKLFCCGKFIQVHPSDTATGTEVR